ncbi:hypothetical protein Glove_59g102 [Diversispora epigaea]|uniref:PPM-type phosphatase domain-containing protein n=1 Tax=Diversispora epigaea TaxID=1348612 RepID=A0A397JCR0_9GLOM|nr:hypothetical protein Glove_59g102 [Diversispora epigaea]
MDQTLSEPVGDGKRLLYVSLTTQGKRDGYINIKDTYTTSFEAPSKGYNFFGLYDGHGGDYVANYCANNLHNFLSTELDECGGIEKAIENGYFEIDGYLRNDENVKKQGCTAITVIVTPDKVYVGNAGDSRAVISEFADISKSNNLIESEAILMSNNHIPAQDEEFIRIKIPEPSMPVTRAIGYFEFKKSESVDEQVIIASPDIKEQKISENTEFLVLANYGIWNVFDFYEDPSQAVIDFISEEIVKHLSIEKACNNLLNYCQEKDSNNNMTIIVVAFLKDQQEDDWYNMIKKRHENTKSEIRTANY